MPFRRLGNGGERVMRSKAATARVVCLLKVLPTSTPLPLRKRIVGIRILRPMLIGLLSRALLTQL